VKKGGAAMLAATLLAGCASLTTPKQQARPIVEGLDISMVNEVFVRGFTEINERAYEEPDLTRLFVDGLNGLKSIDSGFNGEIVGKHLQLTYAGKEFGSLSTTAKRSVGEWSLMTLRAIVMARRLSPAMMAADHELIYKAVFTGALKSLDSYSRYSTREQAIKSRLIRDGVIGLGVRFDVTDRGAEIEAIVADGPAELAGLRIGDTITHANSVELVGRSVEDIRRRLDGTIGTTVVLTVARPGQPLPIHVVAALDLVVPETVESRLQDGVLELRITSFNQRTAFAIERALITAMRDNGGTLTGVVLDLRNDPGGLLDQAVEVADLFLDGGTIVTLHGRHPGANQFYAARRGDIARGLPLAVIIDGKSASASEILVAALQDNQRAAVVGTVSWGKGSVQTLRKLPNGGELALSWSRVVMPRGVALHGLGLLPHVCLSGTAVTVGEVIDRIFDQAKAGNAFQRQWQAAQDDPTIHERLRLECPAEQHPNRPIDLEVARRIVSDPALFALATRDEGPQLADFK
jgi:carboxyl-terminal processing protease